MITHRLLAFEVLTALLVLLLLVVENQRRPLIVEAFGYSYSRFIGPVRGPERQIIVHDRYDGRGRVDYVARPEYQFAYGVEDAKTRVLQNRRETRNGDAVKGVYSVVDPDGSLRVVKYTADNVNGFQAEVISNGVSTNHGQDNPVVAVHPDPQQLVDVDGRTVVDGDDERNQVNTSKDETEEPHRPNHHIQVQHPDKISLEREEAARVPKIPADDDEEIDNESSRDASEYQEEDDDDANDDGGKSYESKNESQEKDNEDTSEEVEDY